jgi:hypothetical protein
MGLRMEKDTNDRLFRGDSIFLELNYDNSCATKLSKSQWNAHLRPMSFMRCQLLYLVKLIKNKQRQEKYWKKITPRNVRAECFTQKKENK